MSRENPVISVTEDLPRNSTSDSAESTFESSAASDLFISKTSSFAIAFAEIWACEAYLWKSQC